LEGDCPIDLRLTGPPSERKYEKAGDEADQHTAKKQRTSRQWLASGKGSREDGVRRGQTREPCGHE
jgi:hypothetical protein